MTDNEQLEAARRAVRNPRPSSVITIDNAALQAANNLPRVVDLSSLVGFLAGAPQQAQQSNQQFQNASNESGGYYTDALNKLISSTGSGSPAAQTFGAEQQAALQPMFQQQRDQLAGSNAAQGITNSGSGSYNNTQLSADQGATLANAIAPLYSQALGQYGNIAGQQAGTQSGLVGQGATAANNSYGQAIQDFYGAASTAATGLPISGGGSSPGLPAAYTNYAQGSTNPYYSNPYQNPNGSVTVSGTPSDNPYTPNTPLTV